MFHAEKHHVRPHKRILIVSVIALAVLVTANTAFASPVDDKRKKAAALAAEIQANGDKISAMSEAYNNTQLKLSNLKSSVNDAKSQLESAEAKNQEVSERINRRAVQMYSGASDKDVDINSLNDTKRKDQYADIASGNDSSTIQELQIAKETLSERKAELEKQLTSISEEEKSLLNQKKALESANANQVSLLNQTKGELATLIAQQQARAITTSKAPIAKKAKTANQSLPTNLPAPSPKAAIAIEFARQQLGKPYRYAATGPDSYDCSGLTMRAYGAAGLSLPHYSGAQYAMFPKVPTSELQPGDLVFRGPGGSAHVALYIGNGLMITAPSTGDVVKIAPVGKTIGGARPG